MAHVEEVAVMLFVSLRGFEAVIQPCGDETKSFRDTKLID
jgi:hypothetical protein